MVQAKSPSTRFCEVGSRDIFLDETYELNPPFSLFSYKFGIKPGLRGLPKLHRRKIVPEAMKLHSQMYTAFAEYVLSHQSGELLKALEINYQLTCRGDTKKLSQTCTEGLLSSFRSRIASRPRNQRMRWMLHKHFHRPRIVSNRAVRLPIKHSALRQVVLRMDTRQSLARLRARLDGSSDSIIPGTGEQKNVKEYLVLQKRILQAQEGEWIIWGTTDETDVKDIIKGKVL